jgi:hypothetical protein
MIILWYSVVLKNKNTSFFNNLLVEAGGVEPLGELKKRC